MANFKDIRTIEFYKNKNTFTGSANDFNYRISTDSENFKVEIWKGYLCYNKSEILNQELFSLSEDGFKQIPVWLQEQSKII
ncbi:hypothetical protein RBG61_09180 [Paludicola sp. MB14-C6]|uniref:hypothetical protein n=1 Tax=Paludihabitans sp. MB14-C6 TaxID=3070656 RepID=UPI0027DB6BCD|nr:hypothetical protein [Paludicola sp. MB14-C6]WMJ22171.1 hypothetical protein RBG61_09180 [Paludicola sp. MB14-C6]